MKLLGQIVVVLLGIAAIAFILWTLTTSGIVR
jgi:hypothetical protein